MGPAAIALIFIIFWWLVWFMALPFGIRVPEKAEKGHATSAPIRPRLWLKAGITTAIAGVITAIIATLVALDILSLESFAT
jgi:predicted secreted protein